MAQKKYFLHCIKQHACTNAWHHVLQLISGCHVSNNMQDQGPYDCGIIMSSGLLYFSQPAITDEGGQTV